MGGDGGDLIADEARKRGPVARGGYRAMTLLPDGGTEHVDFTSLAEALRYIEDVASEDEDEPTLAYLFDENLRLIEQGTHYALRKRRDAWFRDGTEVRFGEDAISVSDAEGRIEALAWSELDGIYVLTTSGGPIADDVFWVLCSDRLRLHVPQTAAGEDALARALSALPGFDHENLIRAMSCSDDHLFTCWRRVKV